MSNVGRRLTLVIEIQTSEYPQWITDAHMKQAEGGANGVKVKKIAEGDSLRRLAKIEEAAQEVVDTQMFDKDEVALEALRDALED
jgi:hypothetical protein